MEEIGCKVVSDIVEHAEDDRGIVITSRHLLEEGIPIRKSAVS